jgi:hypothetical protein
VHAAQECTLEFEELVLRISFPRSRLDSGVSYELKSMSILEKAAAAHPLTAAAQQGMEVSQSAADPNKKSLKTAPEPSINLHKSQIEFHFLDHKFQPLRRTTATLHMQPGKD